MKHVKAKNLKPGGHNSGSGDFNQGSKQDNEAKKVITISDKEKLTGHRDHTSRKKKK